MKPVVQVNNLSKMFRINESRGASLTMREAINSLTSRLIDKVTGGAKSSVRREMLNQELWALKDVSFTVNEGDAVALVGRNGSGKSTLLKILSRIMQPTHGRVDVDGRIGSLLEVGTGFHPELSGRENVYLNGAIIGMPKKDIDKKFDSIVAFSGVEDFLDTPVKHYSSGMYVRLAFAVASHLEPDVFLVDEALAVGDSVFQKKCLDKLREIITSGRTVIFVSHNASVLSSLCTKGLLLKDGALVATENLEQCLRLYAGELPTLVELEWEGDVGNETLRVHQVTATPGRDSQPIYQRGEVFSLRIRYEIHQPNPLIVVGVDLCKSTGEFLCATRFTDVMTKDEICKAQSKGIHDVVLEIDTRILTEGRYLLKCNFGVHNVVRIVSEEPMLVFTVTHSGKNPVHETPLYTNIVYPDWAWQLQ